MCDLTQPALGAVVVDLPHDRFEVVPRLPIRMVRSERTKIRTPPPMIADPRVIGDRATLEVVPKRLWDIFNSRQETW